MKLYLGSPVRVQSLLLMLALAGFIIASLVRRETALSVGNLVGANLIDLSLILPLCAILSPSGVPISGRTLGLDLPVCLGLCVLAAVPPLLERRYRRWQGALLLGLYGAYLAVLAGK